MYRTDKYTQYSSVPVGLYGLVVVYELSSWGLKSSGIYINRGIISISVSKYYLRILKRFFTILSWKQLKIGVRFFCKKWSHLNGLSTGIVRFENCQPLILDVDNDASCHVTLGQFQK